MVERGWKFFADSISMGTVRGGLSKGGTKAKERERDADLGRGVWTRTQFLCEIRSESSLVGAAGENKSPPINQIE